MRYVKNLSYTVPMYGNPLPEAAIWSISSLGACGPLLTNKKTTPFRGGFLMQ